MNLGFRSESTLLHHYPHNDTEDLTNVVAVFFSLQVGCIYLQARWSSKFDSYIMKSRALPLLLIEQRVKLFSVNLTLEFPDWHYPDNLTFPASPALFISNGNERSESNKFVYERQYSG